MFVWMSTALIRTIVASSATPLRPKVDSPDSNSPGLKSIHPMCICCFVPKLNSTINNSTMFFGRNAVGRINGDS